MASSSSSFSFSRNWRYDVFPNFYGEDVRRNFLAHFLKELDRKLIVCFKDQEIERSSVIGPAIVQAIRDSRIAVVVFTPNYASSSWSLNELVEIVRCKEEFGQTVIPIFYNLDPSDVRKQRGDFGKAFEKTCSYCNEEVEILWRGALTNVANVVGYHSRSWPNEARMIEEIANDVMDKLLLTPPKELDNFVGIEDHIAKISVLLKLDSQEVRKVGILGSSGIGKTTIARALFHRLSLHFESSIFIDKVFVSKSTEKYSRANPDNYNMKLHLQEVFLAEILGKKDMKIDHLGAARERLKNHKALIFVDDLDDRLVLQALVGQTQYFGNGSRIIVITNEKHLLTSNGVDFIYEVCLPSDELALQIFCLSAFRKKYPPTGLREFASEVVLRAGSLPLGLTVLGSYFRGRNKEDWMEVVPRLRNCLNGKIDSTLRFCYDGLNNKNDEALFCHIACIFNGEKVSDIKLLLADSDLDVDIGFENLVNKSLIHVREREGIVEMPHLLQQMGKEIVRTQTYEPGERKFLVDSKDICEVLEDNTGTQKVLGISLDIDEIEELHIHKSAFKWMNNLLFLKVYSEMWDQEKNVRLYLSKVFDYYPPKLRLLRLDGYPVKCLPSNFLPENLVKLQMRGSKLEKLWEGVHPLQKLKIVDLGRSRSLKEIPDLSMAINLETLNLSSCSSLVEVPSSFQHLNKLKKLDMSFCKNLETLPTGINLQCLDRLTLRGCSRLRIFPNISTNIKALNLSQTAVEEIPSGLHLKNLISLCMEDMVCDKLWEGVQTLTPIMTMVPPSLTKLWLSDIPYLVKLPSSFQNLKKLKILRITRCTNLETLPTGINLESLERLNLEGCSKLKSFPDISTNITKLNVSYTAIKEVPWWIENFSKLAYLTMNGCDLQYVSPNIHKLKHLGKFGFSNFRALPEAAWNSRSYNILSKLLVHEKAVFSLPNDSNLIVQLNVTSCFNLDRNTLLQQQSVFKKLIKPGVEVPLYFTNRSVGTSLTIPLLQTSPSRPFFRFKACAVVDFGSSSISFNMRVSCRFIDRLGNHFELADWPLHFSKTRLGCNLVIFDYYCPLDRDNAQLAELNYDRVHIQFHLPRDYSQLKLKGIGIRLPEDGLPHVFKGDKNSKVYLGGHEIKHKEEFGDREECKTDGILWGAKSAKSVAQSREAQTVQGGKMFYKNSRRDDSFLGEVNTDATSNSQNNTENRRVDPVTEENKHENVSKSSTIVIYERHMPHHTVFINFGGEEVYFNFISHLVSALSSEGVKIAIGNYKKKCENLGKTFQSIEDSNIALVVFSTGYTESRWCLDELVKIRECMDERKLSIIPIFYKIKPLQVKQLEGDFGLNLWNLWRIHRDHHIVKWKDTFESVATMMGPCLKENSSESEFITSIVKEVIRKPSTARGKTANLSTGKGEKLESLFNKGPFFGLKQRMKELEQKLEFDCNETRIIGVVGMAGIGKNTLAKMLHDKWNCKFVRCAPLLSIREKFEEYGPERLRKTLLELLLVGEINIINNKTTHESVMEILLQTKVFVILDDVSNREQLNILLGDLKWIKKGSKVIITSCDKSLIQGFVHDTYVVPLLNYGEALQLFNYHAFGDHILHPTVASMKLCREFLNFAGGNPQVIKFLGKQIHGGDEAQWEMREGELTYLGMEILEIFKFSYEDLSEKQKDVLLDIACFFRSKDDYFVRSLLDSGDYDGSDADSEVRDLTHKGMIAISSCQVEMHDLLYMFGKIFSSQASKENGGKSRLWITHEIIDALTNQKDPKSMRGIFLDMYELTKGMVFHRPTFINMINLRYLKVYDSCCPRACKSVCKLHLPDGLELPLEKVRYLHWVRFPLEELPVDFRPENLVDLRLPYSKLKRVWEGDKATPQLKWVDLSHSSMLLNLSALAKAERLQRLNLEGCTNLDKLPGEMQNMKSLVYLNLRGCILLLSLPKMNLISLKTLILSNCSNLKKFQVISKSLEVLHLDGTAIKSLPPSIKNLQRLILFNMKNCKMLECLPNCLGKLKVLEELILSGCSKLKNLPDVRESMKHVQILLLDGTGVNEMPNISCFVGSEDQASVDVVVQPSLSSPRQWPRGLDGILSLRRLCLSGTDTVSLQNDIGQLYNLTWLDVKQCKKLRSVPMLPPRLQYFDAHGCDSLEKLANPLALPVLTEQVHSVFNFTNCEKLDQDAKDSIISYTRRRSQLMLGGLSRYSGDFTLEALVGTCFPGWEVPDWFSNRGYGSVLEPKLPPQWCETKFTGIALCAVILFPRYHEQWSRLLVNCSCQFKNEDGYNIQFSCTIGGWNEPQNMESSHVFIGYTSRLDIRSHGGYGEEGCFCTKSSIEFQVTDGTEKVVGCEILQCGFSLVYATDERENICWDANTLVLPKRVINVLGEEESFENVRRDDDNQYQSYSGPNLQRDVNYFNEREFNVFKNAGGQITISSNRYNIRSENVGMSSLIGVEPRLKQLEKVLYSTPGETRIVGVVGMSGTGKTTLANILFEKRGCKFPRNLFLTVSKEYIAEGSKRMFLEELLEHVKESISEERTDESVKNNLAQTKNFVVLDNVTDKKQLEFLLGKLNWIKKGSKIVVTACEKSLVEGLAHDTYVVPHLNNREAFQVFIYHAHDGKFCIPAETFLSLSRTFVDNVGGNPLALKLLGNELRGKDQAYWEDKLQKVTQSSNTKIQDVWRFYTDQLNEEHIDLFLDIACFSRSEDEYFIWNLLNSGEPGSNDDVSEVRKLAEKFLITISDGQVKMDDRLSTFSQNLGSPMRLRLWNCRDILDNLRKMRNLHEANNMRGIFIDLSEVTQSIAMNRLTFINMSSLRYLKIYESLCPRKGISDCILQFPDGFDFPLEEIQYFHWLKFPLEELPPDFRPRNLVDLRLPYSNVARLWKGVKDTPRLKWVDLSHSRRLVDLSGLAKAESLRRLNLEGCTNLDELPGEMRNMRSLVYLNMRGCIRLSSFPKMNLSSLKSLILSDCSNLKEVKVISKSLEILHLDGTAIKQLPPAIQKFQRLYVLNLKNCKMLECLPNCLGKLKVLEELILSGCSRLKNLPDVKHSMKHVQILIFDGTGVDEMPSIACFIGPESQASVDMCSQPFGSYYSPRKWPRGITGVSSLRRLCLSGHDFVSLQHDIGQLYNLTWLDVKQCKKLISVPVLPPRLQYFDAHGCDSLQSVANPLAIQMLTDQIYATFNFSNCNKLDQDAIEAIISYTRWKGQLILNALSRYSGGFSLEASIQTCFPGWEVPAWFSDRASGSSLEPKLSPHWCGSRFTGIALCAVILFPGYQNQRNRLSVICNCEFKNEDGSRIRFSCTVGGWNEPGKTIVSPHVFIGCASKLDIRKLREDNEEGCIHTEVSFEYQVTDGAKELEGYEVLKCGFSLLYASDDLQVNSVGLEETVEANQDLTSSKWVEDLFGYIFLALSCVIVFAILSVGVSVFAPKYYLSVSDFCWPLLARLLFFVAFGLYLK